jgi:hypothetical protein
MYIRFRDSLINPRNIVDFRNDSIWLVLLYVVFFSLLLSTRTTITSLQFNGISPAQKVVLAENFEDLDPTCGIVNGTYICDTKETRLFYEDFIINYYVESNDSLQLDAYTAQYNVIVYSDQIVLVFGNSVLFEQPINELNSDIQNLSFALQSTDEEAFNTVIFDTVDEYIMSYKSVWAPLTIAVDIISSFLLFIFFIILSAFMMRIRFKQIPFKKLFVMTAYSSTSLYVILIFNSLFSLNILLVILLIFFAFRQNNQLSLELLRRLHKKP